MRAGGRAIGASARRSGPHFTPRPPYPPTRAHTQSSLERREGGGGGEGGATREGSAAVSLSCLERVTKGKKRTPPAGGESEGRGGGGDTGGERKGPIRREAERGAAGEGREGGKDSDAVAVIR